MESDYINHLSLVLLNVLLVLHYQRVNEPSEEGHREGKEGWGIHQRKTEQQMQSFKNYEYMQRFSYKENHHSICKSKNTEMT